MFSAVLLAHDDGAKGVMEDFALESKQVSLERALYRFPQPYEVTKLINGLMPDLVFLDLSEWDIAMEAAAYIREMAPHVGIIGYGAGWDAERDTQRTAAGVTELLISPVSLQQFQQSIESAIQKTRGAIQENLFAFLPAKAGSGCTTIALNTAAHLTVAGKVLLVDGDLNSGIISVLLGHKHQYSLRDALNESERLDYSSWNKFVTNRHGIDLLLSENKRRLPLPLWSSYHHLLDFAASRYSNILIDLPEVVNDATVETVRKAKRVFVVCTPELPSLALAPLRCGELTSRGIPAEKINIIVNRWHRGEIRERDVEGMLQHSVAAVFQNDYRAVSSAAKAGAIVGRDTGLGKSFAAFARKLAGAPEPRGTFAFLKGLGSKTMDPARI